jgi:hypothetical protein
MYIGLYVKCRLFLRYFKQTRNFSTDFLIEKLRTDRQTDMTNLKVAFRNFVQTPKNLHL